MAARLSQTSPWARRIVGDFVEALKRKTTTEATK
jgi:hypothetical protein